MPGSDLSTRLEAAVAGLEGPPLVAAVEALSRELSEEEREELGRLLLERAKEEGSFDYGLIRRIQEPWLQLFRPRPREPGRSPGPRGLRRDRGPR